MKRFFMSFLAIFLPWAIFIIEGRLELALLAMILQASVIGWIPISFVAWKHREVLLTKSKKSEQPEQPKPPEPTE
jgi:hypothetical protein